MKIFSQQKGQKSLAIASALSLTLLLPACGDERQTSSSSNVLAKPLKVNSAADLAQESAEDYNDNVNGLITGQTLKHWISDWENNRPAGIKGKLVILQANKAAAGYGFIKPDNKHVFTYQEAGWREPRSNGVTEIAGIVISGPTTDSLIRRYGIDVHNDLIVCAQARPGGSDIMNMGRCWYTFRYWGVDQKNLAVLDGGNAYLNGGWTSADFTDAALTPTAPHPSPIINKQVSSVKELRVDNTILQATLEDMIDVLPLTDSNDLKDGVFLWDGRSLDQFSAGEASEAGGPLADPYRSFQNNATRQGHPRGSVNLNWQELIDSATGLFKSKSEIKAYLDGFVDSNGKGFVDGSYQHLGVGNAYQKGDVVYLWCETSARAAVTQIASALILGLPSRLYDAATIEWNSLTGGAVDKNGVSILPADSPWRTDVLSAPHVPNKPESINARNAWSTPDTPVATSAPRILDPYAERTNAVILADQAYKKIEVEAPATGGNQGGNTGGNSGGGVVLPPNPCGG